MNKFIFMFLALVASGCTEAASVDQIASDSALYDQIRKECHAMTVNDRNGSQECRNFEIVSDEKLKANLIAQRLKSIGEALDAELSLLALNLEVYFSEHFAYPENRNAIFVAGVYPPAQSSGIELTSYTLSPESQYTIQLTHAGTGRCREASSSDISVKTDCN